MAYSLDDLTTPLTVEQVEAAIYETLERVGASTTAWQPGSVVRTMIRGSSIVLAAISELTAKVARSAFLEYAEGRWLELLAFHVYGVEKQAATFAEGHITLTNSGGGIYDFDAGDLIVANPSTGKQYRAAAVILGANQSVTVPIVAVEAGAESTSAPGAITQLVTPLLGVSLSNGVAVVGMDAESDVALRARCREQLGALSPFGPWDAYANAVRTAKRSDGSRVGVTRVRVVKDGFGNVTTYVATASGGVTGTADNPATDLGALDDAIQRRAAPLAVTATTASAVPVTIAITYRVWLYNTSGLTQVAIADRIRRELVAFMSAQPIGGNIVGSAQGRLYHDAIRRAIGSALPQIFHVEVTTPASDVLITGSQVPVLGVVTPTAITQVPPTDGTPA